MVAKRALISCGAGPLLHPLHSGIQWWTQGSYFNYIANITSPNQPFPTLDVNFSQTVGRHSRTPSSSVLRGTLSAPLLI